MTCDTEGIHFTTDTRDTTLVDLERVGYAYLAIPCVSANDNVKHIKSNIRYDNEMNKNETNVKYIRIHVYEYTEQLFAATFSSRQKASFPR